MNKISEKEFERQYKEATKRGKEAMRNEPRAIAVRYDKEQRRIEIDLLSGAFFSFPIHLVESLSKASDEEISDVKVLGAGFGIEWTKLDEHFGVEGLLNGRFGSERWMKKFKDEWCEYRG